MTDPIVEEIHKIREEYAGAFYSATATGCEGLSDKQSGRRH